MTRALVLTTLLLAGGVGAARAETQSPAATASAAIRGDNVLIEGKLYSPQALFIVTRRQEAFGRDAIVPQYLDVQPDAAFLPYRLRADRSPSIAAATADSSAVTPRPTK